MALLIGKKAYGVSGAGQAPREGLAGREGEIIGIESDKWGTFIMVRWNDGSEEGFTKHTVKPVEEFNGIGVYYE